MQLMITCHIIANTQVFALRYRIWSKWFFGNTLRTFIQIFTASGHVTWPSIELSHVHPLAGLQTRKSPKQETCIILTENNNSLVSIHAYIVKNKNNYFLAVFCSFFRMLKPDLIICRLIYTEFLVDWFTAYYNLIARHFGTKPFRPIDVSSHGNHFAPDVWLHKS